MNAVAASLLSGHAFLRGMHPSDVALLADATLAVELPAGHRLFDEGAPAANCWLLTAGQVALDLPVPGRPSLIVETLGSGDVIGFSWLSPPHEWQFGATAVEPTRAFELDGPAVQALCDEHPRLGYQLAMRMLAAAVSRLQATRIRLLDLYAPPGGGAAG
ncbi:MAG TPA: cyclic nucleotide-binding domain-containing protein [Streptosporangiaceae bacterium]|nr:cyclic nucleotide-binding domain-containing protein [Streptosporangiaceae bacterium]